MIFSLNQSLVERTNTFNHIVFNDGKKKEKEKKKRKKVNAKYKISGNTLAFAPDKCFKDRYAVTVKYI